MGVLGTERSSIHPSVVVRAAVALIVMPPRGRWVSVTVTDARLGGVEDLAGDLRRQRLGEHRAVAEAPQVELEALALDAPLARHVDDLDRRDVGLAGDRAHRRQLLGGEAHLGDVGRRREHLDVVDGVPHRRPEHA